MLRLPPLLRISPPLSTLAPYRTKKKSRSKQPPTPKPTHASSDSSDDQMKSAITLFTERLATLRTGRASPALLDPVRVSTDDGGRHPLLRLATIRAKSPSVLSVSPFDPEQLTSISKAIASAGLNLNPQIDGAHVRVPIPRTTMAFRATLVRSAGKHAESAKVAIRLARRRSVEAIKAEEKAGEISKDDSRRAEKDVQKQTEKALEEVDRLFREKEEAIGADADDDDE